MTRKRHTEEQIIAVLKDAQVGVSVQDLYRKHGISDATFYKWRTKYSGLDVSDVKRGGSGNSDSVVSGSLASPKPPGGG
jgi:putative transposase